MERLCLKNPHKNPQKTKTQNKKSDSKKLLILTYEMVMCEVFCVKRWEQEAILGALSDSLMALAPAPRL